MADEADLDVELSRTVRAPAAARAALRDPCGGRVEGRMLSDAKLLTSELVTNALRHGDGKQVGGWGLGLVEDIATRWGVHEGTTHVWFEIERQGPRLGEDAA